MNKYQEAKANIINTLIRIVGYPTFASQVEKDFDVLDELVEKATPKKPIQLENKNRSRCPNCKNQLPFRKNALKKQNPRIYCDRCGQALDWSKEDVD